jgi:lysophospholipase L1-like esterase
MIILIALVGIIVLFGAIIGIEIELAKHGPMLTFNNPTQQPTTLGTGPTLTYVVLGDSTAAGEGASSYTTGIAQTTARYLAKDHTVTYVNFAISGSRARDVLNEQVAKAVKLNPDVVLIAIGANDVMHLTSLGSERTSMNAITDTLTKANCNVKIVLTGSPDMGAVTRLAWPLRGLAGNRTKSINSHVFVPLAEQKQLTFAPIAAVTGPQFRANPTGLLAADHFHPNDKGYATWEPVLETALTTALNTQPSHCEQKS